MKKLIIIVYEIFHREFIGKLLLGLKSIEKNFCVLLVANCTYKGLHFFLKGIKKNIPNDTIIIDKYLGAGLFNSLDSDFFTKFKYITCDAEGMGFSSGNTSRNVSRCYLPLAEKITKVFAWGNKDYNFFKNRFSANNIDENKVVKTGYIEYDVCKKKYRDIYNIELPSKPLKRVSDENVPSINKMSVLKNNKIIVFLGWSYGIIIHMYKNRNKSDFSRWAELKEKNVDNYISCIQKLNDLWYSLMNKICAKYTDYIILFKPHPPADLNGSVEYTPSLTQLIKNPNFRIWNSDNFIEPILLSSKCVIHCGSSCSVQSNLLDVENISFNPIPQSECNNNPFILEQTCHERTATICKSVDETMLKIDNILQNNYKLNISEEIKKNISNEFLVNYEENTFAFDNMIKEFISISNNSTNKNYFTNEEIPIFIDIIKEIPDPGYNWKARDFSKKIVEDLISSFLNIDNEIKISGYEVIENNRAVFIY